MEVSLNKLEAAIKNHLKEMYLPPHRARTVGWTYHDIKFFAKGAAQLSTAFTEGRSELPKDYFNKKEYRSGFLLYYVLPTFVKVWKCLEQLPTHFKDRPLKILDLGSGPGTASLACSAFFSNQSLEILGFEQNRNIKRDAMALWEKLAPSHHLFSFTPKPIPNQKIDLAIASYLFTEIPFREQIKLSQAILNKAKIFIIVEPALQKGTRQLMALRDEILARGLAAILAPCLHQKNCPMLAANQRDWCHFYIDWKCPEVIRHLDRFTGNKHDYLKMAYMIFESDARRRILRQGSGQAHDARRDFWRVVSSPLISKGKKEFILCGDCGYLQKISRLNRDRTDKNKAFDQIKRGDILQGETNPDCIVIRDRFALKG